MRRHTQQSLAEPINKAGAGSAVGILCPRPGGPTEVGISCVCLCVCFFLSMLVFVTKRCTRYVQLFA